MTTTETLDDLEERLRRQIDEHPEDNETRLVLADLWEEQGDPRAAGMRWMGLNDRRPTKIAAGWRWWYECAIEGNDELPQDLLDKLRVTERDQKYKTSGRYYPSAREAEDELLKAFILWKG